MNPKPALTLCLVEDDEIMGESLCDRFRLEGFAVDWHRTATEALRAVARADYAVVVSDIQLPDFSGETLYQRLKASGARLPPFVFITGYGSIERAVALLKMGAADYVTKPFDLDELVLKLRQLGQAHGASALASGMQLGVSPAMQKIETMLPRLAEHASTVLITGESGVGKERVALHLHRLTEVIAGAERPFIAVNCGAITESLIEAELFGHEKGAFTGALRTRKGVFEQAHRGTLLLDEIGDMPLALQVKLLRAIQERRIVRVGGEAPIAVDLRIICATNQDLRSRVEAGSFREDLFYRINVIHLRIPLLRERREDIVWFARLFLREFCEQHAIAPRLLSPAAEQAMVGYPWPGNLRELRHAIERACILSSGATVEPQALFEHWPQGIEQAQAAGSLDQYIRECERSYIQQALQRCDGHIANTAAHLGISRKNLWEKMKRLQIQSRTAEGPDGQAAQHPADP